MKFRIALATAVALIGIVLLGTVPGAPVEGVEAGGKLELHMTAPEWKVFLKAMTHAEQNAAGTFIVELPEEAVQSHHQACSIALRLEEVAKADRLLGN